MMKVLIVFNSSFQLIAGIQVIMNYFAHDQVDALITDRLAGHSELCENAMSIGIFENVYDMETKGRKWNNYQHTFLGFFFDKNIEMAFPHINDGYQICLFGNISGISTCIATYLHKKFNTRLYMFEDGFVAYSDYYRRMFDGAYRNTGLVSLIFYRSEKRAICYVEKYFVFDPDLISEWKYDFQVISIPQIEPESRTLEILNKMFNYDCMRDDYKKKVVFFEESYFADGIDVGDVTVINQVAEIVGFENIIVKIHPRNSVNRFAQAGFVTNINTSVPWEIIALNQDFKDTILITISSGSSITSYFVSKQRASKSVLLYEMKGIDRAKLTPSIAVFDKICKGNPYFVFPHSIEELREILRKDDEE